MVDIFHLQMGFICSCGEGNILEDDEYSASGEYKCNGCGMKWTFKHEFKIKEECNEESR